MRCLRDELPRKRYLCQSKRRVRRSHNQGLAYRKRAELRLFWQ
jgi:hypothetical protein